MSADTSKTNLQDDAQLNSERLVDLENMTPGQVHVRRWRAADRAAEQIAEREKLIAKADTDFKELIEVMEYQIGTYVKRYVHDNVVRPIWMVAALFAASYGVYYYVEAPWRWIAFFVPLMAYMAAPSVIRWREHRRDRDRLTRRQERCKEPDAKDREVDLFFGGEERMNESDRQRDEFRRYLSIDEMRFLDRYGYLPKPPVSNGGEPRRGKLAILRSAVSGLAYVALISTLTGAAML